MTIGTSIKTGDHKKVFGSGHKRLSIRWHLIMMNFVLLCLLFPMLSAILLHREMRFRDAYLQRAIEQKHKNMECRSESVVRNLALSAGKAAAGYDFTFLNTMLADLVQHDPVITYAVIMNLNGLVLAHSDPDRIGSVMTDPMARKALEIVQEENKATAANRQENPEHRVRFVRQADSDLKKASLMEAIVPVYNGGQLWGILRCGNSLHRFYRQLAEVQKEYADRMREFKMHILTLTGLFFLVGTAVSLWFTRFFVRSIQTLGDGVHRVSQGDLNYVMDDRYLLCSEFIDLSRSFNLMTEKLKRSYEALDGYSRNLERKVLDRTRELKEAHAHLMQQAHEAGMAEMAVGMLHNIGNAVTPVKVGTTLLLRDIEKSPVCRYTDGIMETLAEVVAQAPISPDEKERLVQMIQLLSASIREEYGRIFEEVGKIHDTHEHIETIIRLRLRYSRLLENPEELDVNQVVEDALRLLKGSISSRFVQVEKRLAQVPFIRFDKAKLIQIIINFIKNGYEAMAHTDVRERRLVLSTYVESESVEYVVLSVRDTGEGFTPDEKARMFSFGYTTKDRGFGFGLHSAANYLIANQCQLSAHSGGKGKGAEFVVRVPVSARSSIDVRANDNSDMLRGRERDGEAQANPCN